MVLTFPWLALLLLCSGLSLGADCLGYDPGPLGTPGLLGNFSRWPDAPIASGGAQLTLSTYSIISLHGAKQSAVGPWVSVSSTNPAVLSGMVGIKTDGDGAILVQSGIAGTAELQLFDATGKLVERFPMTVKTPTSVVFPEDQTGGVLFAGTPARECPVAMAGSEQLLTGGTLRYAVTGTLTMLSADGHEYEDCSSGASINRPVDHVWFTGTAGQGDVTVTTAEGLASSRTWKVVAANDVATITLTTNYDAVRRGGLADGIVVLASALTKDGQLISGANCTWSVADPTVRIASLSVPNSMSGNVMVEVHLPRAGSFAVTCAIGNTQATAQLVYPAP